ncbi:MAG: glycoside hydrolase family 2 TIM barrel-domain containing protein [Paludibacter sp.]
MKKTFLILTLSLLIFPSIKANNPRIVETINESWKFCRGDFQNILKPDFDDSKWEIVSIPHTWNKEDGVDEIRGYYRGISYYRRTINIPIERKGKQVFVVFKGVNQETELFINGKLAGSHVGGYTRFCFDITDKLNFGQANNFVVKVNNRSNENIPPLSGDFTFFGGIYRDVSLLYTEKQHISTTFYASSGVFITTPAVSENEAKISIKTLLANEENSTVKLRIENIILSPSGEQISNKRTEIKIAPNTSISVEQNEIKINKPLLWSPDSPSLYKVITRVYNAKGDLVLDEVINPLGLRWYEFSGEKGFFLNGKSLKLIGTNRHQFFLNMGSALPDEIHVRDIKLLKEMGGNFLRVSHYPQDQTIMEMCDKLGIICSVEIPIVNGITETEAFTDNCLNMAREMVMQDFNRPSVMIWAYMNEVMILKPFIKDSVRNKQYFKSINTLATKIENQIRQDDPARYTMIPCHGSLDIYLAEGLIAIPKIIGLNIYQGWYGGTCDGLDKSLNAFIKKIFYKPIILSEYGADADSRLHSFDPQRFDYTQEYANLLHEHYIKAIQDLPYVAGGAVWNLNDFYSESRTNAVPHVNCKGIVGLNRELKDTYLDYQAVLSKTPIITIGGMNWNIRGGNADQNGTCIQPVKVYSNQKEIELFLNGKSLGNKPVVDNIAQFNVPFVNGKNILDASAISLNGIIRDQLKIDFRMIPFNLKDSNQPFTEINVMLGSKRYFEDKALSSIWLPEKKYSKGSWGYIGGHPYAKRTKYVTQQSDLEIFGTSDDPVFQTMRIGIDTFKLDVPDGKYTVCCYWAELQSNKDSEILVYNLGNDALKDDFTKRSFDVDINNTNVLKNLDLTKEYGLQRAVVKKFDVNVVNGQGITVNFNKVDGEPILNAIRVYRNY